MQPNDTSTTSPFPTVPAINITLALSALTPQSFTDYLKQQTADALAAAFPSSVNIDVYILNVRAGSVACDVIMGIMDGNTTTAISVLQHMTALYQVGRLLAFAALRLSFVHVAICLGNLKFLVEV